MSLTVEKLEHNMVKTTIEVDKAELDKAITRAYNKQKKNITAPGFRKGKVPQAYVEKIYGTGIFFEDAANDLIQTYYEKEISDSDLEVVSRPEIDIVQLEKGKNFIFTAEVAVKPAVKLGRYKDIEVEKSNVEVTEDDINGKLAGIQEQNSRIITIEDRPVQDKDTVTIDFAGSIDGVPFEGGQGKDYDLVIGSHSFIDNFEEQLIGKNIGDSVDVNVTFPEDYHVKELASKPALFKVDIKKVTAKSLPELNDDFAQDVSDFDTMEEYKKDVEAKLLEEKQKSAKAEKENKVIEAIVANAEMDIPKAMIDTEVERMVNDFAQRISYQGLKLEQYFQFTGLTMEKFKEQTRPQAESRIKSRLVLEAIAEVEQIEVTEEDLDKEIENMASIYQMEVEKLKDVMRDEEKESIKKDIAVQKAVDLVTGSAIEKEVEKVTE